MSTATGQRRSPLGLFSGRPTPGLYDRTVAVLRARHYSRRTEEAYLNRIRLLRPFPRHPFSPSPFLPFSPSLERASAFFSLFLRQRPSTFCSLSLWERAGVRASGYNIRTVQELLGHKDVRTTMIYT